MISISATAANILASTSGYTMYTRCESWKDGELLDGDIPVTAGTQTTDVTLNVPETAALTVPALYRGTSYVPGNDRDHPLACWGQKLHLSVGLDIGGGMIEWIGREWHYITETDKLGDAVTVTASGLLGLILEADFVAPVPPVCAGNQQTFGTMLRKMVEPAIHVDFTNAPTDRLIPIGTVWEDSRLDSLNELLTMWPADVYVDTDGMLQVIPVADTTVSSLSLTDGIGGTAMKWSSKISREGAASCVVARGITAAGVDVQAVVYDTDTKSPTQYGGPFNALPVPYVYTSSLLTTAAECRTSASATMALRKRQGARRLNTSAVPHLALQARDAIIATSEDNRVDHEFAVIDSLTMPLTASSGPMQLGIRFP